MKQWGHRPCKTRRKPGRENTVEAFDLHDFNFNLNECPILVKDPLAIRQKMS